MKEWRSYFCEEGESPREELVDPDAPFLLCPNGDEPVMVCRRKPSERLVISLIPMAREIDDVTGKIGLTNSYKLEMTSLLDDDFRLFSQRSLKKEEALQIISQFSGLEKAASLRVWKSQKL